MADDETAMLQVLVERMRAGEETARDELIQQACGRLLRLTRAMLKGYPRLKRWEETDDVFQNAVLRLCRSLQQVHPGSVREFFGLAATQIRRELIDLIRHHYGPEGAAANRTTNVIDGNADGAAWTRYEASETTHDPGKLAEWTEFHRHVDALPEEEREVFGLIWYQGLTQSEVASVLSISASTVKRRWRAASSRLNRALEDTTGEC